MLSAPVILREIARNAVNEVFAPHRQEFRAAGVAGLDRSRAAATSLKGESASGGIQLAVEEAVLDATSAPHEQRQDLVNELTNMISGYVEAELLRRGLAIQYAPPRSISVTSLDGVDVGQDGVSCLFEGDSGRVAVAIQLTLLDGARIEALPTRRLPERNGPINIDGFRRRSASVLVVDDSSSARSVVVSVLAAEGFEVLQAESGVAALRLLRERPSIGMVFTDLHMAGLSGADFIRKMKAEDTTAGVPIVVLTASPGALSDVDTRHIVTCLIKPISPAAVISLARRVLATAS